MIHSSAVPTVVSVELVVVLFKKLGDFGSCELPNKQKAWKGVGVAVVFRSSMRHLAVAVLATLFPLTGGVAALLGGLIEIEILLVLLVTITDPGLPGVIVPLAVALFVEFPKVAKPVLPFAPPTGDTTCASRLLPTYVITMERNLLSEALIESSRLNTGDPEAGTVPTA